MLNYFYEIDDKLVVFFYEDDDRDADEIIDGLESWKTMFAFCDPHK